MPGRRSPHQFPSALNTEAMAISSDSNNEMPTDGNRDLQSPMSDQVEKGESTVQALRRCQARSHPRTTTYHVEMNDRSTTHDWDLANEASISGSTRKSASRYYRPRPNVVRSTASGRVETLSARFRRPKAGSDNEANDGR